MPPLIVNSSFKKIQQTIALPENAYYPKNFLKTVDNGTVAGGHGASVAAKGDYFVVGAPSVMYKDGNGNFTAQKGQAYLYDKLGNLLYTFSRPELQYGRFGSSVAISETYVAISAPWATVSTTGQAGAVCIYDLLTGSYIRTIVNPTPSYYEEFGTGLAIHGNTVLIGTNASLKTGVTYDDSGGVAYVYDITTGANIRTIYNPNSNQYDVFGSSLTIANNYYAVGAWGDDTSGADFGSVYMYNRANGNFIRRLAQPILDSYSYFGYSLASSDSYLVVGAYRSQYAKGKVHVFDANTGALLRTFSPVDTSYFGYNVGICGDCVIVGSINSNKAYLFSIATGLLTGILVSPAVNDQFGAAVAVTESFSVVGAPEFDGAVQNSGRVHLYT